MAWDVAAVEHVDRLAEFPDPDEGNSDEERAALVRPYGYITHYLTHFSLLGSKGLVESRFLAGSLAKFPVSSITHKLR